MNEQTETITISNRDDFSQWALERATEIVADQGDKLVIAARERGDEQIKESANALAQAIIESLLEVFDGLIWEEEK